MPSSRNRVPDNTEQAINARIRRDTEMRIQYFDSHRDEIDDRLHELDEEWDIERTIEANAAALAFTGATLALLRGRRRWLALSALVSGFLFQHATQGWCPPVPALRRLGFRTAYEIEEERRALMALRGDFDDLPKRDGRTRSALRVARSSE